MKIKFYFILALVVVFFIASCRNTGQKTTENTSVTVSSSIVPQWIFNSKEDTLGNPQTQIFLLLKDSIKITETTGAFRVLEKQEYAEKKLPTNTLTACWGFWAGLEQQFIVVDSSDCWVVKAKYQDEGGEEERLETLKVIKK